MQIYYKVVNRNQNNELTSYVTFLDKEWLIYYKPNEWTLPKKDYSRIFIFKTLEDAKNFLIKEMNLSSPNKEIWECEATGIGKIQPIFLPTNIDKYWLQRKLHKKISSTYQYPKYTGSLSAKSIKLLRKVNK